MNIQLGKTIALPGYEGRADLNFALPEVYPCDVTIFAVPTAISEDGYFISMKKASEVAEYPPCAPSTAPMLVQYTLKSEKNTETELELDPALVTVDIESITACVPEYEQGIETLKSNLRAAQEAQEKEGE